MSFFEVGDPARASKQFQEQRQVVRVVAKFLVDQIEVLANQPDGRGAYAPNLRIVGEHQENAQQEVGLANEILLVDQFEVRAKKQRARNSSVGTSL